MAEYLIQGENLTAIADEVRELSGTTIGLGVNDMTNNLSDANTEVGSQADLIVQIQEALQGKAVGGGSVVDNVSKDIIARTIVEVNDNEIDTIGHYAFYGCSSLTSVSFPAATTIGSYAFTNCTSLQSVSFPAATSIGINAFSSCNNLVLARFPTVVSLNANAFMNCTNLRTASFPEATQIATKAFFNCTNL